VAVQVKVVAVVTIALLTLTACTGDDADEPDRPEDAASPTEAPEGDAEDAQEDVVIDTLPMRLFRQLPVLRVTVTDPAEVPAMTSWHGGVILLGVAGGLVRFDDGNAAYVETEGLDHVDGTVYRTVESVASSGETLVAVGREFQIDESGLDQARRASVWRSTDSIHWELLDDRGLDEGDRPVRVRGITVDPADGSFLAYGEVLEAHGSRVVLWRSEDGEQWSVTPSPGLDASTGGVEHIADVALLDDRMVAVHVGTLGRDRFVRFAHGTRGSSWEIENDTPGLGDMDLDPTDPIPTLDVVADEFAVFGSAPVDVREPLGERAVTFFHSEDGRTWQSAFPNGPTLGNPFFAQVMTATPGGFFAITEASDHLTTWRTND
jgi:hypothetical protein